MFQRLTWLVIVHLLGHFHLELFEVLEEGVNVVTLKRKSLNFFSGVIKSPTQKVGSTVKVIDLLLNFFVCVKVQATSSKSFSPKKKPAN